MAEQPRDLTHPVNLSGHPAGTGPSRTDRPVYTDFKPPCNHACPAGENIQAWLDLAQAGHYRQAWEKLIEENPMPAVHGRVCYHPCEDSCNRSMVDSPVSIHAVERFLGDEAIRERWSLPSGAPDSGKRVMVVGAGPSGLSAAWHLRRKGHAVEVFEAGPVAGGMMHFGIPSYRLPRDILAAEVARIERAGVVFHYNRKVDDLRAEMETGRFDAAFIAIGAHLARKVDIPARDASKILDAVSFLRDTDAGNPPLLGRRVAVYGGGNTAMDAARTALRLGASDARRMGLDFNRGQKGISQTANGQVMVSKVQLDNVRIGGMTLHQVDAVIHQTDLPIALLGMSVLNRMEMQRDGSTMTLKKRF